MSIPVVLNSLSETWKYLYISQHREDASLKSPHVKDKELFNIHKYNTMIADTLTWGHTEAGYEQSW